MAYQPAAPKWWLLRTPTAPMPPALALLTAIFMPLNLVTGFFGMNFDGLPLIHSATGVWMATAFMAVVGTALGWFFWRKRYLSSSRRP